MVCWGLGLTCRDSMSDYGEWVRVVIFGKGEGQGQVHDYMVRFVIRVRVRAGIRVMLG